MNNIIISHDLKFEMRRLHWMVHILKSETRLAEFGFAMLSNSDTTLFVL
jgi:hypothetical protein